jgi:hypothetical protein
METEQCDGLFSFKNFPSLPYIVFFFKSLSCVYLNCASRVLRDRGRAQMDRGVRISL